jgi:hypothetical protein
VFVMAGLGVVVYTQRMVTGGQAERAVALHRRMLGATMLAYAAGVGALGMLAIRGG